MLRVVALLPVLLLLAGGGTAAARGNATSACDAIAAALSDASAVFFAGAHAFVASSGGVVPHGRAQARKTLRATFRTGT
jgi:hypothetical protein